MSSYSFTKLFSSITDSSIWSEDSDTKVVWVTLLAMSDLHGFIAAAIPGLAKRSGVSIEATEKAILKFMSPDKYSRSQECEGRRIVACDGGWMLINHGKYRDLRQLEDRKEQNRLAQERFRLRKKQVNSKQKSNNSNQKSAESAHTDTDTDTDKKIERAFKKPTNIEIEEYAKTIEFVIDGNYFLDYQDAREWKLKGGFPIKNWKAVVRTWKKNELNNGSTTAYGVKKEVRKSLEEYQKGSL